MTSLMPVSGSFACAVLLLPGLGRDHDQAAEAAGLKLNGSELHEAPIKGRKEPVQFYALQSLADVPV